MIYELIEKSERGVLIDRTPILRDVRDTFKVSFLLPDNGAYLALLYGADGTEYRKPIVSGEVKVPHELLNVEQFVGLAVCKIDEGKITHAWECEPIKVTALFNMRRTQWQLSGGTTDQNYFDRLIELERLHAQESIALTEFKETVKGLQASAEARVDELKAMLQAQAAVIDELRKSNGEIAAEHNRAIGVINDLSERLAALEKNYDPTIIE